MARPAETPQDKADRLAAVGRMIRQAIIIRRGAKVRLDLATTAYDRDAAFDSAVHANTMLFAAERLDAAHEAPEWHDLP
jgi:hypothetical protein